MLFQTSFITSYSTLRHFRKLDISPISKSADGCWFENDADDDSYDIDNCITDLVNSCKYASGLTVEAIGFTARRFIKPGCHIKQTSSARNKMRQDKMGQKMSRLSPFETQSSVGLQTKNLIEQKAEVTIFSFLFHCFDLLWSIANK